MGDEATFDNLLDCKCANDHKVGKDGVHVRVHGLKSWNELSLVGRGAVQGAKILPRSQHTDPARLAERGFDNRILMLCASVSDALEPTTETTDMDVSALLTASAQDKAELIIAKMGVTDLTAKLAASDAALAEALAKIALLSVSTDATLKANHDAAVALLDSMTTAALAASGRVGETLPVEVVARVALFTELRDKLAIAIPVGGRSKSAADLDEQEKPKTSADFAAFKTN